MNTRQRAVLALLAVLAALLFPVVGWFFLAGTMPAIHVRTVAPNGTVIACGSNGTCVYDNTIDIFNAISGSHELFGPLQVAFFVGALTGGFAVALVLLFLTYFVWGEAKETKEEKKTIRKDSPRLDAEKSSQQ